MGLGWGPAAGRAVSVESETPACSLVERGRCRGGSVVRKVQSAFLIKKRVIALVKNDGVHAATVAHQRADPKDSPVLGAV